MSRMNPRLTEQGCSITEIARWRSEVTRFFETEWEKLRSLMMELEERSWNEDGEQPPPSIDERTEGETPPLPDVAPANQSNGRAESAAESPRHRLAELAEQIEQRIQAHACGSLPS